MSAAERVMALVSGLPSGPRERRRFMVLQVYIDDSSTDGQSLVLAGYIASSEQWAAFSNEWQELLSVRPAWRRFKMSEIMADRPGVETQERVIWHYRLIEKYTEAGICIALPRQYLLKTVKDLNLPSFVENPYCFAWAALVSVFVDWQQKLGINEPIDFIFDQQSEATAILLGWDHFVKSAPEEARILLRNTPIFRSDEEFLPLQAADLFAWWVRRKYDRVGTIIKSNDRLFPWKLQRSPFPVFAMEYNQKSIRKHLRHQKSIFIMGISQSWAISSSWTYPGLMWGMKPPC